MADDIWSKTTDDILGNISWNNEPNKQQGDNEQAPNWAGYWATQLQNAAVDVPEAILGIPRAIAGGLDALTQYNQRMRNDNYTPEGSWNPEGQDYYSVTPTGQPAQPGNIWGQIEQGLGKGTDWLEKQKWTADRAPSGTLERIGGDIVANAPQMAVTGLATALGTPALGLAVMSGMVAGDEYNDLRSKGVDSGVASAASFANAAAQAPFERFGIESWIPTKAILKNHGLLKAVGKGFGTEGITEAIQELPDEMSSYIAQHGSLDGFDYGQLGLNAAEATVVGGFYGALFSGLGYAGGRRGENGEPTVTETPNPEATDDNATDIGGGDGGDGGTPTYTPDASTDVSGNGIDIDNPQFAIADDADYADMTDSTKAAANLAINEWNSRHPDMPMTMTSGKRNGDGSSHHDSGNAFDVVCDAFEGEDGRKYRDEYSEILTSLGLTPLDEYNGSGNEAYARGENFHATVPDGWTWNGNTSSSTDAFLAAIAQQESGGEDDPYNAVNNESGAFGKYQITPDTWAEWAPKAGVDPSDTSPEAQDKVARAMADYYRQEFGDEGAAVAWYAGENAARRYVNGEMSPEEIQQLQGQYPSIAAYAASIRNRMGGGSMALPSVKMEEPKSAAEFLKDLQDSADVTTPEGQAREAELKQVLQSSKEEQEKVATKLGWKKNAQGGTSYALENGRQVNTQDVQGNATQPLPRGSIKALPTQQTRPIEAEQANGTNGALNAIANTAAPVTNAPRPVSTTNTQGIIPQRAQRVRNTPGRYFGNAPQENAPVQRAEQPSLPRPSGPLQAAEDNQPQQAQQKQEKPKEPRKPSNARIQKALNDKPFNDLVKRAYVDGDQSAMEQVQKANPYLVEAVRNKVVGGNTNETTKTTQNPEVRELLSSNQENQPVNTQSELPEAEESEIPEGAEEKQPVNNPQTNTTDSGIKAGDRIEVGGKRYTVNGVFNGGKGKSIQATGDDGITFTFVGDKAKSAKKVAWNNATPEEIEEAPAEEAPKAEPSKAEKPAEKPAEEQAEKPAPKKQAPAKKAAPKKAEPKPAKTEEKAEEKPAKAEKPAEDIPKDDGVPEEDNPFGSPEDAFKDLEEAFDIKPLEKKTEDKEIHLKHKLVDDSDEAIEGYLKELNDKASNLHSGFDPTMLVPAFKICAAYVQRGIAKFATFADKVLELQKSKGAKENDEKIKPWLKPAWEAVNHFMEIDANKFEAKKLVAAVRTVGSLYAQGTKNPNTIKQKIHDKYGDKTMELLGDYIDAAYKGVQEYYAQGKASKATAKAPKSRKLKTATVRTDDGKEFGVTYKIVPADSLVTSNTWDGGVNEKYPPELQPRDRTRKTMNEQVDNMARHLNPKDLAEARSVNEGAPLVNADNVVENGNGRTMAISRAYHHGGDAYNASAKAYKDSLVQNAEKYGYTADEVRNMKNPVLVRQRSKDSDSLQKSIINSTAGGMNMGAGQQAKVDAQKLTNDILRKYYYDNGSWELASARNRPFVVSALNAITGPNDRDVVFDKNGKPTKAGIQRVKSALTALAYGDNTLLDRMSESTDESNKNIVNAFMAAAPQVAIIRNRVNSGDIPKSYDLPSALSRVVSLYFGTKEEGKSVKTAINEVTLDGKTALNSEGEEHFALFVDENTRKPKKISSAIVDMVKQVETANDKSGDLFKDVKRATLSEIMDKPYRDAHRAEGDLFSAPQEKKAEEKKEEPEQSHYAHVLQWGKDANKVFEDNPKLNPRAGDLVKGIANAAKANIDELVSLFAVKKHVERLLKSDQLKSVSKKDQAIVRKYADETIAKLEKYAKEDKAHADRVDEHVRDELTAAQQALDTLQEKFRRGSTEYGNMRGIKAAVQKISRNHTNKEVGGANDDALYVQKRIKEGFPLEGTSTLADMIEDRKLPNVTLQDALDEDFDFLKGAVSDHNLPAKTLDVGKRIEKVVVDRLNHPGADEIWKSNADIYSILNLKSTKDLGEEANRALAEYADYVRANIVYVNEHSDPLTRAIEMGKGIPAPFTEEWYLRGYLNTVPEGKRLDVWEALAKKFNPYGMAKGFMTYKQLAEDLAKSPTTNYTQKNYINGNKVPPEVYNYSKWLHDRNVLAGGKNSEAKPAAGKASNQNESAAEEPTTKAVKTPAHKEFAHCSYTGTADNGVITVKDTSREVEKAARITVSIPASKIDDAIKSSGNPRSKIHQLVETAYIDAARELQKDPKAMAAVEKTRGARENWGDFMEINDAGGPTINNPSGYYLSNAREVDPVESTVIDAYRRYRLYNPVENANLQKRIDDFIKEDPTVERAPSNSKLADLAERYYNGDEAADAEVKKKKLDYAVDSINRFKHGKMRADESPNVTTEGGTTDGGRSESTGRTDAVRGRSEGGEAGEAGRETAGGNRAGESTGGGREHGQRAGSNEQKVAGGVQERPRKAERGTGVESPDSDGTEGGRTPELVDEPISPKVDKIEKRVSKGEMKDATDKPGHDYHEDSEDSTETRTPATRRNDNIAAIKLLKKLEAENRKATPDEQAILAKYSGWGGLTAVFNPGMNGFAKSVYDDLKATMTKEEWNAASDEANSAFYTPNYVVKAMWDIARRLGFKGGRVLDPACATGKFFSLMPADMAAHSTALQGIEKSSIPARIAAQLYQGKKYNIANTEYQQFDQPNKRGIVAKDNFYDLAITNVPFSGKITIGSDKTVRGRYQLHNFYFAKTVNKVRPGGLIIFMTSNATMDNAGDAEQLRRELSQSTELVGAFRLPTDLFKGSNAKVTTDIIALRKLNEGEAPKPQSWEDASPQGGKGRWGGTESNLVELLPDSYAYGNRYFVDHPDNVIGKFVVPTNGRYDHTVEVVTKDDNETSKLLNKAIETLPQGIYEPRAGLAAERRTVETADAEEGQQVGDIIQNKDGTYSHVAIDSKTGNLKQVPYSASNTATVRDWLALDKALGQVLDMQVDPKASEEEVEAARKQLNTVYDKFVKAHGYVNARKNMRLFGENIGAYRIFSIENFKAGPKGGTAEKTEIFTERTAYPPGHTTLKINNVGDALIASQLKFGHVDIDYMAQELHKSTDDVVKELGNSIFFDPDKGTYVTRDEYLSGNVREKLVSAENMAQLDPSYQRNVDELKAVIPKDLKITANPADGISLSLGMSPDIVPVEDVQAFTDALLGVKGAVKVSYNNTLGRWRVQKGENWGSASAQVRYGKYGIEGIGKSSSIGADEVIEACMKNDDLMSRSLFKPGEDDTRATLEKREQAKVKARDAKNAIEQAFVNYVISHPDLKKKVENNYNNRFNANVLRKWDGSFLQKYGLQWVNKAKGIKLRPHQLNAVWRILNQRATLLAHCVGSGKTWTMQAAGMELKRLGLAHKILYITPSNVVPQFAREFYQINPSAKILVIDKLPPNHESIEFDIHPIRVLANGVEIEAKKDAERSMGRPKLDANGNPVVKKIRVSDEKAKKRRIDIAKRNAILHKIKVNDWDAIIMSHDTFKAIPMSDDYMINFLNSELDKARAALNEQKLIDEEEGKKGRNSRNIETIIDKIKDTLAELMNHKTYDMGLDTFETLGIDQLFVDEADIYRKLETPTQMSRISGISTDGNEKTTDFYAKMLWLMNPNNAHGAVFATGTPISNSVVELYTMFRYLGQDELDDMGIRSFDQFAKLFLNINQGLAQSSSGQGVEYKNMVLGLNNAPECINAYRQFADVQTIQDLPEIARKLPKAHYKNEVIPKSPWWTKFQKDIAAWFDAVKHTPFKERKGNMSFFAANNTSRDAVYSPYMVDKNAPAEEAFARAWKCADNVYDEYVKSNDRKGTQLIFCDRAVPGPGKTFDIYNVIKKRLIEDGIPEKEIAFIEQKTTDAERAKIFQAVNKGEIRVLIGSTAKMGAGTNMQTHLVALHHYDCPWMPRDIEQREGRILRQGNENSDVTIYSYINQGSYDGRLWDIIRAKTTAFGMVLHGDPTLRTYKVRDVDANDPIAKIELAQDNPKKRRLAQAANELREAQVKKITYDNAQRQAKAIIATYPQQISISEDLVKKVAADIDMRGNPTGAKFSIKIGNTVYDNQNKANEAMAAQKEQIARDFVQVIKIGGPDARLKDVKVGTCKGFDIYVSGDSTAFRGTRAPESLELLIKGKDVYKTGGTNTARGVWNAIFREPDAKLDKLKKQIESDKMELEEAQKVVKETFGGDAQIEKLKKEIDQLNQEIAGNSASGQMEDAMRGGDSPVNVEAMFSEDDPVGGVEAALRESRDRKDPDNERLLDDSVPLSVSFNKPSNWDEDYKDTFERTGWNITDKGGKITIETTSGEMENLSQIYSGEVEDFRDSENYEITDKADNTIHYDRKALEAEVMDNFPNAQNVVTNDSGMEFDLPNGFHMTVNFTNEAITVDRAQASKAYGREIGENETARGSMRITTDRNGIMTLTVDTVEETPSHEAMHFAMQFLTPRERAALNKMYKNEEAICEGMRAWKIARKNHKGTLLGKIFQRISDLAYKVLGLFHETDKNVFRKVAEGQMWERKSDNASAAKVSYLMGIGNAADDFLKKHSKYLVKPGETREVEKGISIKGRKADTGWGGITSVLRNSVISPSRIKDPIVSRLHAMGDRATRVQQELYAKWGTDYSTNVLKHLDTDDKKKAFDDLMFAEDSLKHEFTDAELREEKVDEDVIKAHDNARRILKDVYKHVNDVYTSARPITHSYNTRKEAEAALKDAEKQPYTEVLGKITEIHMPSGRVRYQLTIKQPKSVKHTAQPMSRRELAALKRDKYNHVDHITYMSDGSLQVSYTSFAKPLTNMEGYMPHLFHDFFVIAKAKDGSTEVVGSATTQKSAIEAARKYRAEHPEMDMLVAPKQFASEGDVQNPILLGDKDYHKLMKNLSWGSTMTLEEAEELSNAAMKGRHVFFSALKKRKGVQGFEHNARWAIQQHIASSARYCALDPFKSYSINLFERAYGDYYKDYGTLSKEGFAKGYIDSVLGKPGTLEKLANKILNAFPPFRNMPRPAKKLAGTLTGTVGLLKLGASPAAAFVNVLQILNANLYLSPRQVGYGMKRAMHLSKADEAILRACGTDEEVGLSVEGGMDKARLDETGLTKAGDRYRRLSELAMKPFTMAESYIRRATTLAAYYDYMDKHKNMKDKTLLKNNAIAYAREINRKVNFDYSVSDAPRLFRALEGTVVGDVALQFQKYGVKQLEVISDLFNPNISAKNKVAFIVPYLLIGGLWNAAPFEDLLLSLIGLITGTDDPEDKAKKAMMEWAGNDPAAKALVNLANYGVGSVVGMDISQRAGLKGVTPNTNPLTGGAFGSTVAGLGKAILNADAGGAIKSLSPEIGNIYQAVSGHGTDSKGRKTIDYEGYDRVMKALGFRTVRDATAADYQNIVYNYKETKRNDRSKARQAYLEDPSSKNYSKLRELGYTAKQIDALKKGQGNDNRLTRAEKGLSKKDLKDLQGLRDYVQ